MASLDILCSNPLNLKNKIAKVEHKKKFCGPSKFLKNVSWSINICLKNFMPLQNLSAPLQHTECAVPKFNENKIAKNLGLFYKAKYYLNKRSLLVLYYSFIHTYSNYRNRAGGSTNRTNI